MRKLILFFILFCFVSSMNAQWQGTNPLWTNAYIGIGTTTPTSPLTINKATGHRIPTLEIVHIPDNPTCSGCFNIGQRITVSDNQGANKSNIGLWINANNASNNYAAIFETGNVGIGTTTPRANLDMGANINNGRLGSVFGRLPEGDNTGNGTYIGVKGYDTQLNSYNGKSFSIEHSFYGQTNSSINFFRGGSMTGGFITFNTNNNTEKMLIDPSGNVGIGTSTPRAILDMGANISNAKLGSVFGRLPEGDNTGNGTYLGVKGYDTQLNSYNGKSFSIEHSFYGQTNSSINFFRGGSMTGGFITFNTNNNTEQMLVDPSGNVGIGTDVNRTLTKKLEVNGTIRCQEVLVEATPWPDYVFAKDYKLKSITEVDTYIKANNHLPDMPAASEVEQNGVKLSELNTKLLQKVEELTLYIIQQSKEHEQLRKEFEEYKKQQSK